MNPISVSIDEFPDDDLPWRIDGLGRLHSTGSSRTEPLIDVHLSQLVPDYDDPLKNESLGTQTKRIPIKVGLMALLKPGSVWKNKERYLSKFTPRSISTSVAPGQVELRKWGSTVEFEGHTIPLISKSQFNVPVDNWRDLAESWVVFIRRPLSNVPYVIIPSSVIFQKCFAESPDGIRRLLQGELHRIIDNPHSVETGDGVASFFVELAKEIRSTHAYAYANLVADPIGGREYARMRRTLVTASINEDRGRHKGSPSFLNLGLPFSNPVSMRLHGKLMPYRKLMPYGKDRIKSRVEFAFLATEIVSLDVRLIFDRLIVHRKNSGDKGENAGDPNLKEAWGHPRAKSLNLDEDAIVPTTSDNDPLSELETLLAEESGGFNALNLEIIKDPKLTQKFRSCPSSGREDVEFDGTTTTGDVKSGDHGPAALDVEVNEAPRVPVTLDSFIETLQILRDGGIPFETKAVATMHRYTQGGDVVNFFPRQIRGSRSWHLHSDAPDAPPRGYIVATLLLGGTWHHLVELERKEEKGRSLAYIRTIDGSQIEERQMRLFMLDVAHERGWNAASLRPHWTLTAVNHSPKRGLYHFALAIAKSIGVNMSASALSTWSSSQSE